jgi:uncharacterized protein YbjT (DUF2867 family)
VVAISAVETVVVMAMEVAMAVDQGRVAMVAGATGLVGREILAALLADKRYKAVHSVGRRKLPQTNPKLVQHVVDFAAMSQLSHIDEAFIALGTTIKVAGSKDAFRAVDFDAVLAVARTALASGATKLGVVSAMGADAGSAVFYNRVKGQAEEALVALEFPTLVIARPSMLAGHREALGQPVRHGERFILPLMSALKGVIPANYQAVDAKDVAYALLHAVQKTKPGVHRLLSGALQGAARSAA